MVLPDISDAEAAAHIQYGETLLTSALRKFLTNVEDEKKRNIADCCRYIHLHWNEFFKEENKGIFLRLLRALDPDDEQIPVHYYVHKIESLRKIAIHIGCPHLEEEISNLRINDRHLYRSSASIDAIKTGDSGKTCSFIEKGKTCFEQNKWSDGIHIFSEILAADLNQAEAYFYRAKCQFHLGLLDFAMEDVRDAIELNTDRPDYYAQLAEILRVKQEFHEALASCNKGLTLDANNEELLCVRGKCLHEIETNMKSQIVRGTSSISNLLDIAKVCFEREEWKKAMALLDLLICNEDIHIDQRVDVCQLRALCKLRLSLFKEAEHDIETAMLMDPYRPELFVMLAEAQIGREKFDLALMSCEEGLNLDPANQQLVKLREMCLAHVQFHKSTQTGD